MPPPLQSPSTHPGLGDMHLSRYYIPDSSAEEPEKNRNMASQGQGLSPTQPGLSVPGSVGEGQGRAVASLVHTLGGRQLQKITPRTAWSHLHGPAYMSTISLKGSRAQPQGMVGPRLTQREQRRTRRLATEEKENDPRLRFSEHLMTGLTDLGYKLFSQFSFLLWRHTEHVHSPRDSPGKSPEDGNGTAQAPGQFRKATVPKWPHQALEGCRPWTSPNR